MKKLIWLIIIAGAIYYGYNNWIPTANNNNAADGETEEITSESTTWHTYKNSSYANYSIQYPSYWDVVSADNQTIFTSADKLDSVVIALKKNGLGNADGIQTIKEIAGRQVLIIEGEDPDDGSPAKFIIFNLSNDTKLEVRGFGTIFDKMIDTLVLSSEQPQTEAEENIEPEPDDEEIDNEEDKNEDEESIAEEEGVVELEEIATQPDDEKFVIKIYYQKDPGDNCSSVTGLIKEIDTRYNTDEVNTLVTLTQGLSSEESNQGYTTSIPYGTRLRNLEIRSGVATADFNSTLNEGGGSCEMAARRAQITETLIQFPDIEQVIITVDGDVDTALQP